MSRTDKTARSGPWRLRARVGLLVAVFTLLGAATAALVELFPGDYDAPVGLAARSAVALLVIVPLLWLLCRSTGGATLATIGLSPLRRAWPGLLTAVLVIWAVTALLVAAALASGAATLDPGALTTAALSALLLAPLLLAAQVLPEELVFRGYVQHFLGYHSSQLVVLLAQAALFALSGALILGTTDQLAGSALIGLYLGLLRQISGGIWAGVGARLALATSGIVLTQAELTFVQNPGAWDLGLGLGAALAAYFAIRFLHAKRPELTALPAAAQDRFERHRIPVRGILYDVGSSYMEGQNSREHWRPDVVREEMRVIREDLHCTAVTVFGKDLARLEEAAGTALDQGLDVWIQPRSQEAAHAEILDHVGRTARFAERLRQEYPAPDGEPDRVVLNVGCEFTVLNSGIVPGRHMYSRALILWVFVLLPVYMNLRLNRFLRRVAATARAHFHGPLTYGSGSWEAVDWDPFDIVGVDYYLDATTRGIYRQGLRHLRRHQKPVAITEFGSCTYVGAPAKGGGGADVLDWRDLEDRTVREGLVRSEQDQADHIEECVDVYETEDVHAAFVCMFIEGDLRYSTDPVRDCDMASLGIVRPPALESGLSPDDGHWEPKLAFHALARRYGADVPAPSGGTDQG